MSDSIVEGAVRISEILLTLTALMGTLRLSLGPTPFDRVISVELIALGVMGTMILVAVEYQLTMFLDLVLLWALVAFIGTVHIGSIATGQDIR